MKLINYLEQKTQIGKLDILPDQYNIKIEYTPFSSKELKVINFKIPSTSTVRKLSQEIRNQSDDELSISANDDSYKKNKKLYDIFLANDPEFNVFYDDKEKKYQIKIINIKDKIKGFFTRK